MSELTLFAAATWMTPWVFHVMVALEEKQLPYRLDVVPLPIPADRKAELQRRAVLGKVPILAHGDVWISESLAISEYIEDRFTAPQHPTRVYPEDVAQRARARQVLSFLRTSLFALREDRPTTTVFGRPTLKPMSDKAKADAAELVRVASSLVTPGSTTMFGTWCIADADLALALMRLVANQDALPQHLVDYTLAQWDRRSVRRYMAHVPTAP